MTISGRLDLGTANIKVKDTDTGTIKTSTLAGDQHGRTTSRLTFSGTEDLGGGLKASFNYETRLNPDNTAAAGLDRTRNMFLNLSGNFGSLTVGTYLNSFDSLRGFSAGTYSAPGGDFLANHINVNALFDEETVVGLVGGYTPSLPIIATADAGLYYREGATATVTGTLTKVANDADAGITTDFERSTVASSAAYNTSTRATNAARAAQLRALIGNGMSSRSTNSIGYTSPDFGGLRVSFGITADSVEGKSAAGVENAQAKVQGQLISAAYTAGPLKAQVTAGTGKVRTQTAAADATPYVASVSAVGESSAKVTDRGFAVSYDLGFVQPYVQYESTKGTLEKFRGAAVAGSSIKTSATEVGAKFPMGAFTPYVIVGKGSIESRNAGARTADIDTSAFQVGTTYDLSKRTYLYAALGNQAVKVKADNYELKTSGYKAGLVHQF